jgi:hypothetical protein
MDGVTEHRAIVDTHRHPVGAKMAERGLYDPNKEFPQANAQDLICYREFFDLDYAMPKQREGGLKLAAIVVTIGLVSKLREITMSTNSPTIKHFTLLALTVAMSTLVQ